MLHWYDDDFPTWRSHKSSKANILHPTLQICTCNRYCNKESKLKRIDYAYMHFLWNHILYCRNIETQLVPIYAPTIFSQHWDTYLVPSHAVVPRFYVVQCMSQESSATWEETRVIGHMHDTSMGMVKPEQSTVDHLTRTFSIWLLNMSY